MAVKPPVIFLQHHACSTTANPANDSAAPHLVMLHGWGLHSGVWKDFLPLLTPHFQITLIDLPGFGKTSADISYADFFRTLPTLVPDKAIWLGWSLGGAIALAMAFRHPQQVQALCLLAATPCFVQRPDWPTAMPASSFSDFRDAVQEDAQITLEGFLSLQCKGSVSMKADIRFLQSVLAAEKIPARQALLTGLENLAHMDLRDALRALDLPMQVLLGEKDPLIPVAVEKSLKVLNPRVNLTVVAGAAHQPFVSHPKICCEALLQFCRQHRLLERSGA